MTELARQTNNTPAVTEAGVLALISQGRDTLAAAVLSGDPAAVSDVIRRAEAIRYLSKKAKLAIEATNAAAHLKIDAERRAGAMLRELNGRQAGGIGNTVLPNDIAKIDSHRWQDMARVPDNIVQDLLKTQEEKQAEITSAQIRHMGARIRRQEEIIEKQDSYLESEPDERPVSIVYADPPWRYEHMISDSRKIENQYPTMATTEIAELDPAPSEDAVLFLWVPSPKLTEGLQVMEAWGFTYRTSMVWVKPQIGMGYYVRGQHELLLIGAMGHLPTPPPDARPSSVIDERRTKHSQKPDLRPMLDAMYPDLWKREMFSRRPADGLWLVHGNEAR